MNKPHSREKTKLSHFMEREHGCVQRGLLC